MTNTQTHTLTDTQTTLRATSVAIGRITAMLAMRPNNTNVFVVIELVNVFDRFSEQLRRKFAGHLGRQFAAGFQQWVRFGAFIPVVVGGRGTCPVRLVDAFGGSLLLYATLDLRQRFLGEESKEPDGRRGRRRYDEPCFHRWQRRPRRCVESSAHRSVSRLLMMVLMVKK